jgi:hypothetical protein
MNAGSVAAVEVVREDMASMGRIVAGVRAAV